MKYAVAEFYKDGSAFPVELNIASEGEALRRKAWMKIGRGQNEDWRVVPMADLKPLLQAGKIHLNAFTAEAQAERRAQIMEASA